jgi:hypothetical protein
MIEQLSGFPTNVLGFRASGHVTRQDYETVVDPAVEAAFKDQQAVRLYYQLDSDFEGASPGAMWQDFRVGMEHIRHWERIAVVTDVDWIGNSIKVFGFLIPGEVRLFPLAQTDQAKAWIVEATPTTS